MKHAILLLSLFSLSCSKERAHDRWTLILKRGAAHVYEGPYDSREECLLDASNLRRLDPSLDKHYQECGLNCRGRDPAVCERTVR